MAEETTTEAPISDGGQVISGVLVDDQGQAIPEPEVTESAEAVTPENNTQESTSTEAGQAPQAEDELAKFAEAKGFDPNALTDGERKALEMARNAEKKMHETTVKASELEKTAKITDEQLPADATPEERDNVRVRNLELRYDVQDWKRNNPDKLAHEAEMVKVLSDPVKKELVQAGYITLDDVYSMAVGGNPDTLASVKSQTEKETLQKLAQKQQAAVPSGNAVASSGTGAEPITPQNVDRMVSSMSTEEYKKRLPEINAAMAG